MAREHRWALLIGFLLGQCALSFASAEALGPSIVGIDHIPTAVRNLDEASELYRKLGFTLKPGRFHEDGLRNNHVKFEDGSGIELLSPPSKPTDELTARYIGFLRSGDGPAFIGFHVRDAAELKAALLASGLKTKSIGEEIELDEPLLDFLFLDQDNRSPTDRPEHFVHSNSAFAMTGVWLALGQARLDKLRALLLALGAIESKKPVLVPNRAVASEFAIQNGKVVVLTEDHELHNGRPIVGVEFHVRDIRNTVCGRNAQTKLATSGASCFIPPTRAHGLWLEFHE